MYPDGGCYNDQPLTLLRDWETLDRRFAEIYDHCKDLEPEDIWLPPTMLTGMSEETEAEPIAENDGLLARLRGLG